MSSNVILVWKPGDTVISENEEVQLAKLGASLTFIGPENDVGLTSVMAAKDGLS